MTFKELDMLEIDNALYRARIDTLIQRLNELLFKAGCVQGLEQPGNRFPYTPSTLYVRLDENFGHINVNEG